MAIVSGNRQDDVREALAALEDHHGRLTPEIVLDAAVDPASPLHTHFEWNDEVAAHTARLEQARSLIRSVRVEVTTTERTVRVVNYVRDPQAEKREAGYRSIRSVLSSAELSEATLDAEVRRVEAAFRRGLTIAESMGRVDEFQTRVLAALGVTAPVLAD